MDVSFSGLIMNNSMDTVATEDTDIGVNFDFFSSEKAKIKDEEPKKKEDLSKLNANTTTLNQKKIKKNTKNLKRPLSKRSAVKSGNN